MKLNIFTTSLLVQATFFSILVHAENSCVGRTDQEILSVFNQDVQLNAEYKKQVLMGDAKNTEISVNKLEAFSEEKTYPCVEYAMAILMIDENERLLVGLLKFAVDNKNSADETVSTSLGYIYAFKPKFFEKALREFPVNEQKIILDSLSFGLREFGNAFRPERINELNGRLDSMKAGLQKDEQIKK